MNLNDFDSVILDLDGSIIDFDGSEYTRVNELAEVQGHKIIMTDYHGATPFAMMINAPEKYVGPVIEKKLLEEGVIEGASKILIHATRSYGPALTHVFFTAVPADVYADYDRSEERDDYHHLVCSLNAALYAQLKDLKAGVVVAGLFVHGRHVDILVMGDDCIHAARRITVFGGHDEHALRRDNIIAVLRAIEREARITIEYIHVNYHCHESEGSIASSLSESMQVDCKDAALEHYMLDGVAYMSSSMAMIAALNVKDLSANMKRSLCYLSWKALPLAASIVFGFALALFAIAMVWQGETNTLNAEAVKMQSSFEQDKASLKSLKVIHDVPDFQSSLVLAEDMARAQMMPSMQEVLSDLSYASKQSVLLDHISLIYGSENVRIQVSGKIKASFAEGIESYSYLISAMQSMGYVLIEKNIGMDMKVNTFMVIMEKDFVKKQV